MSDYVTNEPWLARAGRSDAIDEIADQFERPARGAEEFWTVAAKVVALSRAEHAWPRASRGWRAAG